MNRFLLRRVRWLALFCASAFLRADGPDEDYVRIYSLIQQADAYVESGRNEPARQKYSEARSELDRIQAAYPGWNEQVVQFRLNYVIERLGLAKPADASTRREPLATAGAQDRVNQLLEQIRQLTAERELLQAKLKEALSAQPAAVDPRELARSEDKIKSLRKDVEVLTVNLKKAETKPDKPVDPAVFEQAKKGLASANQKLAQQTELLASVMLERDALQRRLQIMADGTEVKTQREENASLKGRVNELQIKADELQQRLIGLQKDLASRQTAQSNPAVEKSRHELASRRDLESVTKIRSLEKELAEARQAAQTNADLVSALQSALREAHENKSASADVRNPGKTLRPDETNVSHTNLSGAQLGQNRLAEREVALKRALASDPTNASSLSELGAVKVGQHNYDEALRLLSQSAQLDPQNAKTFQYLGVTLVAKGMPTPAELAFRRAIQLAPENAEAHHNLAIVYATQQPPSMELARLHYQKGLASGHAKDPKLEQLLSANRPVELGGVNAPSR